jgi:uncharacterized membrane-anchored protein YitT (DUF2179 family)
MGITLLLQHIAETFFGVEIPYTVVNLLLNAIPVYIGFRFIGKKFTLYSCLMIVLSSVLTDIIPAYVVTYDILLISIFGGIISGTAVSMCLLMNATSGGTDFIAIYLSDKKGVDSFNVILGVNMVILAIAGILFGWDRALYSIIFQYASTQTLHMLYRKYQQATLFIVTNKAKEVCNAIYKISQHGATVMESQGSYEGQERSMVYSVVSSAESKRVVEFVKRVDPDAFINVVRTEKLQGRFYHKPAE